MYQFVPWIKFLYPKGLGPGSFSSSLTSSWTKITADFTNFEYAILFVILCTNFVPNFQVHETVCYFEIFSVVI